MICHTVRIPYQLGQVFRFVPLFDLHSGHRQFDKKQLIRDLANLDPETYLFTGGDEHDSIVITDKRYAKSVDATEGEAIINEQVETTYDILRPHSKQLLGIGMGNHDDAILKKSGVNPNLWLAKWLDVPFLGYHYVLRLIFSENGSRGRTVLIRVHHGWGGGGRTQGGSLTKYSKDTQFYECDIFCYGHDHQLKADRIQRIGVAGEKIISKPKLICLCGTYKKTLSKVPDVAWEERQGFTPTSIGHLTINIKPTSKWVEYWVERI